MIKRIFQNYGLVFEELYLLCLIKTWLPEICLIVWQISQLKMKFLLRQNFVAKSSLKQVDPEK